MSLHTLLQEAFGLLEAGASQPGSPWRNPALVTHPAQAGEPPGVRTVVLRSMDPRARRLTIHTDARSGKMAALRVQQASALHGWDPGRRVQLRLSGHIEPAGAADTDAAWQALNAVSRDTYAQALPPGAPIAAPEKARARQDLDEARRVFVVLGFHFGTLEYLELGPDLHRRALFDWRSGELEAGWRAP